MTAWPSTGSQTKLQNGVYKVTVANPNFILTREPGATDPGRERRLRDG